MLDYISVHFSEKIRLEDLANVAGVSKNTVMTVFKHFTLETPFEYLIHYRLERGAELLLNTDKTVTEISYAVGFSSASYFTKAFRERTGMTPLQYRKEMQE